MTSVRGETRQSMMDVGAGAALHRGERQADHGGQETHVRQTTPK